MDPKTDAPQCVHNTEVASVQERRYWKRARGCCWEQCASPTVIIIVVKGIIAWYNGNRSALVLSAWKGFFSFEYKYSGDGQKNCGGTLWDCKEKETQAFTGTSHNQNVNVVGGNAPPLKVKIQQNNLLLWIEAIFIYFYFHCSCSYSLFTQCLTLWPLKCSSNEHKPSSHCKII